MGMVRLGQILGGSLTPDRIDETAAIVEAEWIAAGNEGWRRSATESNDG